MVLHNKYLFEYFKHIYLNFLRKIIDIIIKCLFLFIFYLNGLNSMNEFE